MKRKWLSILTVILVFSGCSKQEKQSEDNQLTNANNAPIEDIVVNKEYDEQGNLIRYDSTYSSFFSNIENDSLAEDSIIANFKKIFEQKYPFSYKPSFNDFFFRDSLMKYDFYKKDFFIERFRNNREQTEKIFQEMDSIKNKFFNEQFPKNNY
ncbi:MAG: hypothetical protein WCY37_04845 [Candidatus Dojkabacteria bacterium]|jgi:hypothetical protein|nr:hypothetical protein [Dysgonamonadaceae bacterium]MDD3940798.1 hypothetical protein [Candidatus Paceibacterota bacterium]MDD4606705.1 hypothetical protein [Dysgonamonadaceae bacterium]